MHADVGEELLAGIFQTGPEDVDHIVDDQETVVIPLADVDGNGRVLLVMALNVELLLLRELAGIDGGRDIGCAIAQHGHDLILPYIQQKESYPNYKIL